MATKRDPRRQPVMCFTDIDILVKVKTMIAGRSVAIKSPKNVRQTKGVREMGFADFFIEAVTKAVKDVKPSREAKEWGEKVLAAKLRERRDLDKVHDKEESRRQSTIHMKQYFKNKLDKAQKLLDSLKQSQVKTDRMREEISEAEKRIEKLREQFERYDKACIGFTDRRRKKK